MFTSAPVCTRCLAELTDSRYRTCNKCRTRAACHQIRQQPNIGNDTRIPGNENTVPSNPPPNFNPFQNSIGPRALVNPPPNFEPNIRNDTRIHENTFPSNPPPNFNPLLNFIKLKPLAPLGVEAILLHQQTLRRTSLRRTSNRFRILYCPPIIRSPLHLEGQVTVHQQIHLNAEQSRKEGRLKTREH